MQVTGPPDDLECQPGPDLGPGLVDLSGKRFIAVGSPPGDPLLAAAHQALARSTGRRAGGPQPSSASLTRESAVSGPGWWTGLPAGGVLGRRRDHVSWFTWFPVTRTSPSPVPQRQQEAGSDLDTGLIPITVPELLRLLRNIVIPPPRRDRPHQLHWSTCRRRHQHRARQAHQRWNAYAETTP